MVRNLSNELKTLKQEIDMLTNDQIIYTELGRILWSIMEEDDYLITLTGQLYPEYQDFQLFSQDQLEREVKYIEITSELFIQLIQLMEELQKSPIFLSEKWTQFQAAIDNNGKFKIEFAYIDEQDSWANLYMKGISDLNEYEAENVYHIPKEIWEERLRLKNQVS